MLCESPNKHTSNHLPLCLSQVGLVPRYSHMTTLLYLLECSVLIIYIMKFMLIYYKLFFSYLSPVLVCVFYWFFWNFVYVVYIIHNFCFGIIKVASQNRYHKKKTWQSLKDYKLFQLQPKSWKRRSLLRRRVGSPLNAFKWKMVTLTKIQVSHWPHLHRTYKHSR